MPEERAEELIPHSAGSRRYLERLVVLTGLGLDREPTRRGRRAGRAVRVGRERADFRGRIAA